MREAICYAVERSSRRNPFQNFISWKITVAICVRFRRTQWVFPVGKKFAARFFFWNHTFAAMIFCSFELRPLAASAISADTCENRKILLSKRVLLLRTASGTWGKHDRRLRLAFANRNGCTRKVSLRNDRPSDRSTISDLMFCAYVDSVVCVWVLDDAWTEFLCIKWIDSW